jgi:hypothetical protein
VLQKLLKQTSVVSKKAPAPASTRPQPKPPALLARVPRLRQQRANAGLAPHLLTQVDCPRSLSPPGGGGSLSDLVLPVGGCLQFLTKNWSTLRDLSVYSWFTMGYRPTFFKKPSSISQAMSFSSFEQSGKENTLACEDRCPDPETSPMVAPMDLHQPALYFSSPNFQTVSGQYILRLNDYFNCPHFKMETVDTIVRVMRPGDWSFAIDLLDAYCRCGCTCTSEVQAVDVWLFWGQDKAALEILI